MVPAQGLERTPDESAMEQDRDEPIVIDARTKNRQINEEGEDEANRLRALATDVRNQDDLERDIGRQVGKP